MIDVNDRIAKEMIRRIGEQIIKYWKLFRSDQYRNRLKERRNYGTGFVESTMMAAKPGSKPFIT